ncbi:MAG: hypothetical protein ISR58_05925 [Anaerolineales bacterium]|nr:hypothetical protein [Anaerolineales bacterium]
MRFCDVIVFHDTYYPPCRKGILSALVGQDVYVDLDLIPGGMQPDGLWGGLGIVITDLPRIIDMHVMLRLSLYPWLRKLWLLDQYRHQVEHLARVFRLKIRQLMRRGKAISRRED